jgi:hypothetical protein
MSIEEGVGGIVTIPAFIWKKRRKPRNPTINLRIEIRVRGLPEKEQEM